MTSIDDLKAQRAASLKATENGQPARTSNPFFGVGPITDMSQDELDARRIRFEFDHWLEENYPKTDDLGNRVGSLTYSELARGMHRGYPADKVLLDMMRELHRYFEFPKQNCIAVGLGGGHSGFTVAAMHTIDAHQADQKIFVDTPRPESAMSQHGGFFRQSWGAQLTEMLRLSAHSDVDRLHFSDSEGGIPGADRLQQLGIKLFFGVGHETTGATTYTEDEIRGLLEWIDLDPENHHAVIDATSLLGSMPWASELVEGVMSKCNLFTPFQKAIGGISGYFVFSLTPAAVALVDKNQKNPSWAIPRQLKIVVPEDPKRPFSSESSTRLGPIYNAEENRMQGGIINTFSTIAFAETTFSILRNERRNGTVTDVNKRSVNNRALVNEWIDQHPLFELGVSDPERRGAAVTLLKVVDKDITDPDVHAKIIARSKQILGFEGATHPNGQYEPGLDVARYVNAFPGTPGDYRAWIGGIRPPEDITALLDNIEYAYHRAKIVVLEELLAAQNVEFEYQAVDGETQRLDDPARVYKILIADLIGMQFDDNGSPDHSEVKAYIESRGGHFHEGSASKIEVTEPGVHFFYLPDLSTHSELMDECGDGQYDALIAAATFIPAETRFGLGGVRIGAGTGNMGASSWGGGNGKGGDAVLMNTPSFNSRATAQAAFKALLKVMPNLAVKEMHDRVVEGRFDTGKHLREYPCRKLEGQRIAVIGYGNIGREVAQIAQSFGLSVVVYARERHQKWIESEGFEYASSIVDAARGADIISPHLGLGPLDSETGRFANAGVIDQEVLAAMRPGAVLINYDRGELVDIDALDKALESGQIAYAAIDADIFQDAESNEVTGPMAPYLDIYPKHSQKLELLPHAAADTEHVSRVQGACQAVDQLFDLIQYRRVRNLIGDLPEGYTFAGARTVKGVGKVGRTDLAELSNEDLAQLRHHAEEMAAFWGAVAVTTDPARRAELLESYASHGIQEANRYQSLSRKLGLYGPYHD